MRYGLASAIAELTDSRLKCVVFSILVGACASGLEYLIHYAVLHGRGLRIPALVDALFMGAVVSLLVGFLLSGTRARRRRILERLRVVAELNHHVRNALQIIVDSQYVPQAQQTDLILESVSRIDRTLRDLFPVIGERAEDRAARRAIAAELLLPDNERAAVPAGQPRPKVVRR